MHQLVALVVKTGLVRFEVTARATATAEPAAVEETGRGGATVRRHLP